MARLRHQHTGGCELNLTSLLDVVFLLIVFFLLVTNFASAELPQLEAPKPVQSRAQELERRKLTVNLIPQLNADGTADGTGIPHGVRVGSTNIQPNEYARLTSMLTDEVAAQPMLQIDLRVDRSIHYRYVQPVMQAITAAGISRINLVAQLHTPEPN